MTKIEPSALTATTDDRPRLAVAAAPGTPLPVASFGFPAISVASVVRPRGPVADGVTDAGGALDETGALDDATGADVEATTGAALVGGDDAEELGLGVVVAAADGGVDVREPCATTMMTTTAAATAVTLAAAMIGFDHLNDSTKLIVHELAGAVALHAVAGGCGARQWVMRGGFAMSTAGN